MFRRAGHSSGYEARWTGRCARWTNFAMRYMAQGLPPHAILFTGWDTVSEDQGRDRHHANDPEAGRDIPRGTDEVSDAERSTGGTRKSAKPSTSGGQQGQDMHRSRADRDDAP